jgi:hypothetical protein
MDQNEDWILSHFSNEPTPKLTNLGLFDHAQYIRELPLIRHYTGSLHLVEALLVNIREIYSASEWHLKEFQKSGQMNRRIIQSASQEFSRLLLNSLTAFKALIDHTEASYRRQFGENSEEFQNFKLMQNEAFDTNFEYRFFYKLRNYCQHIGMPPVGVRFEDSLAGAALHVRLDVQSLIDERSVFGAKVALELETLSDFPLFDHLDVWRSEISKLCIAVLALRRSQAMPVANRILMYRERIATPDGGLCYHRQLAPEGNKMRMTLHWLPEDLAEQIKTVSEMELCSRAVLH